MAVYADTLALSYTAIFELDMINWNGVFKFGTICLNLAYICQKKRNTLFETITPQPNISLLPHFSCYL